MKLSLLTLSGLTAALLLAGCATESAPPAAAPAAAKPAAAPVAAAKPAAAPAPAPAPAAAPAPAPAAAPAPAPAPAPAAAPVPPPPRKVTFTTDVFFAAKKPTALDKASKASLDEAVERLKTLTKVEIIIASGHTDNRGTAKAKDKLGQARADAVKAYLVSKGVAANKIEAQSLADTQPVAYNNTVDGRARNSRVEVEVIGFKAK